MNDSSDHREGREAMRDTSYSVPSTSLRLVSSELAHSIGELIHSIELSRPQHHVRWVVELDFPIPHIDAIGQAMRLLEGILEHAFLRTPNGGEVYITAWTQEGSVEIEIADGGLPMPSLSRSTVSFENSMNSTASSYQQNRTYEVTDLERWNRQASWLGGRCWGENCPQGGVAWTLCLPIRKSYRMAA